MLGRERFGPLTERPFRLLWLGRTGSSIGDSLIPVALAFAVLRIGGGATGLGIVLAAFTIGRASFVVVGGVWADRLPRRAVMITADLVRFKAKDIFRASGLSLLGISNSHVEKDRAQIDKGEALSPLLLVRDEKNRKVVVADGYHRLCAVYQVDEDAWIPCKIV